MKLIISNHIPEGSRAVLWPDSMLLSPAEIREKIYTWAREEEEKPTPAPERIIVTMNRTVMDMVKHPNASNPGIFDYNDVTVWNGSSLVPLSDLEDPEFLAHFSLGDLFDRGLIFPMAPT